MTACRSRTEAARWLSDFRREGGLALPFNYLVGGGKVSVGRHSHLPTVQEAPRQSGRVIILSLERGWVQRITHLQCR